MRNRRSIAAAFVFLAVLAAPAAADWENPTNDSPVGSTVGLEELIQYAQVGYEIAQVAL
jgi:hypothetical protein